MFVKAMIRNAQLKTGSEEKRNCIATLDQSQLIPLWKDSTSTISHDEESDGKTFKVTYAFLIPKGERGQKLSLFSIGDSDVVYDEGVAKEIASKEGAEGLCLYSFSVPKAQTYLGQ